MELCPESPVPSISVMSRRLFHMLLTYSFPLAQALDATLGFLYSFSLKRAHSVFLVIHLLIFILDLYSCDK